MEAGGSLGDADGDWPGKNIDWSSEVSEAWLHVELPFWIAAPDGKVRIRVGSCALDISFRNDIVGIYRNGLFNRDESELMQITAEGFPFATAQRVDLEKQPIGQRHFRTLITPPVRCHKSVFGLLQSKNPKEVRDAQIYVQSLAHASIRFINEFIGAYRRASFDPFVSHVSHWDLPIWHLSDSSKSIWHIPMARYPVADELPAADPSGRYRFRTTEGRIREAALAPPSTSLEELLDAWTCFYRGQFAEAIRKAVTAIEVTISDLLLSLPSFRQNRTAEEVNAHLVKLKFSEQIVIYLRETKRQLPGPLTHMAPEVNGVYLERELEHARARRHKIVHESEKVDYEHDGPILRIMETMSWLHGWLRENPWKTDPTQSVWHSPNKQMRDVFLFEPVADDLGIGLIAPEPFVTDGPIVLLQDVHKRQLLRAASRESLDLAYCVAWAFQVLREPLKDGRRLKNYEGEFERYWFRDGHEIRPVFLIDLPDVLSEQTINAIACRVLLLKNKHSKCGQPLVIVNHLSLLRERERIEIPCVDKEFIPVLLDLQFTTISLVDWVAFTCLLTLCNGRDFGFRAAIRRTGLIQFDPPSFSKIGYVRRVFPGPKVVSIVVDREWLCVGDEICIQNGSDTRVTTIESLEVNRIPCDVVFAGSIVGAKLEMGVKEIRSDSLIYRVLRPLITHDPNVKKTVQLEMVDYSKLLSNLGRFPQSFTGFGTYGGDSPIE